MFLIGYTLWITLKWPLNYTYFVLIDTISPFCDVKLVFYLCITSLGFLNEKLLQLRSAATMWKEYCRDQFKIIIWRRQVQAIRWMYNNSSAKLIHYVTQQVFCWLFLGISIEMFASHYSHSYSIFVWNSQNGLLSYHSCHV